MPKLIVGWFTFTCCEDSTIIFTELLNTHWQEWTKAWILNTPKFYANPKGRPDGYCFVEGAISSQSQIDKLTQIRSLAKTLIAIGSCACIGQPSSQRNDFDPARLEEIKPILIKFNYADKVQKLSDLVTVDYSVPGCPMDEVKFIELMNQLCTPSI